MTTQADSQHSEEVLLSAAGLVKSYTLPHKTVSVLKGASIEVKRGEIVAITGRSGAGKSTILHVLGCLDRPEEGEVFISGRGVYAASESSRTALRANAIGFVFQAYQLFPEMSVLENTMLPAMAARHTAGMRERALALLAQVGLSDRVTHKPVELSGGEQQRVAIARALMNDPGLILADEPTGNLDAATGAQVLDMLFKLVREGGRSMVIVTHDAAVAARCDRTLQLEDGQLLPSK